MDVVDSHLHLWDLTRGGYAWLTPDLGSVCRSYLPSDASAELSAASISRAVLVQADNTRDDTNYMLLVAESEPWVAGVVGWLPLDDHHATMSELDRLADHHVFKGARQIAAEPSLAASKDTRRSLTALADRGYSLDVADSWPDLFRIAIQLSRQIPELTVVIDHLGKPPGPGSGEFDIWRAAMTDAAESPNVFMKVSGLTLPGLAFEHASLAPIWDVALEEFGPSRLMYGGDWPITVPHGGYQYAWSVYRSLAAQLSIDEQTAFYSGTARAAYRI